MKRVTSYFGSGVILLFILIQTACAQRLDDGCAACQRTRLHTFGQGLFQNRSGRVMYPGDDRIDVTYYRLDLTISYTPQFLRGAVTVGLQSTSASLSQFFLDLSDTLRVDSVKAGSARLAFSHTANRLQITLPKTLGESEKTAVTIYYRGRPNGGPGGGFTFDTHGSRRDPVIWTLSQPYGARDWFPCKDTPGDKADSCDVRITAPRLFVSVSNGKLAGVTDNSDSTRTYHWQHRYPIAHYLISLAMSNYVRLDQTYRPAAGDTMPVWHYLYPEQVNEATVRNVNETTRMLDIFTPYFGPYPFLKEKYGHASFGFGGGMEHQTISSMGSYNTGIIAHELAHQWFGDKLTARSWEHIWLHEGFASYAEALYQESVSGESAYKAAIDGFMARARRAQGSIFVENINSVGAIFDGDRTYAKSAVVLHMLRGVVGDRTFREILRGYANSLLSYRTVVTEDFQGIANQVFGRSLDYFFRQWIYGQNYPTYRLTWQTTGPNTGGRWGLQLRVEQSTGTSNPAFFTMPVQFRILMPERDTLVTLFNNSADQTYTLEVGARPLSVEIDPNNRILKQVEPTTIITAVTDRMPALKVRPNPVTDDHLVVDVTSPFAAQGHFRLLDVTGREVARLPERALVPGMQTIEWPTRHLPVGRYMLLLDCAGLRLSTAVMIAR